MNLNTFHKKYYDYIKQESKLSSLTWFNVGGKAEFLFQPNSINLVIEALKNKPSELNISVIGAGSNILINDNVINGLPLHTKNLNKISMDDHNIISVEAGCSDANVARFARDNNRAGLEFLIGIPGTIGGGIKMNSGAFGKEFSDIIIDVKAINTKGQFRIFTVEELQMHYRHISLEGDWLFLAARLKSQVGEKTKIQSKMKEIINQRKKAQPTGVKTGGSTFMNTEYYKAWQLIEKAGCKGLRIGGAIVSDKHCNFIINTDNASAIDIKELADLVRMKVLKTSGIRLDWEIKRIGFNDL